MTKAMPPIICINNEERRKKPHLFQNNRECSKDFY